VNGSFVLDTNIVIGLFAFDQSICAAIESASAVFLPSIVAGELYFGAANSARPVPNRTLIDAFLQANTVLPCDTVVARIYGALKRELKLLGTPIPENDIWIAATALRFGLTLATRDHHFDRVPELLTARW
jgi:tRNA(fMet)-specific endonuclease VapC